MSGITFQILGNPNYNDDVDDPNYNESVEENDYKFYTFDKLPGNAVFFVIKNDELSVSLEYNLSGLSRNELSNFVNALKNNSVNKLSFRPGSNQCACISTDNGIVTFSFNGAGGDNPVDSAIRVWNKYCVNQFVEFLG